MGRSFKVSYEKDMALLQNTWVRVWLVVLVVALLTCPLVLNRYQLSVLNQMGIAVIGALGLNILIGYTGQISLGHAAFMAIGGYTSALLTTKLGFSFFVSLPLSGLTAAALGLVVGVPSLRLKGLYLALGTLAFSFIVEYVLFHWDLTQGDKGLGAAPIRIAGLGIRTERDFFYLIMVFAALAILCAKNIARTKIGRSFIAIRDRDIAAEAMGIPIAKYKVMAFAVSSFYAGVAGCITAHYQKWIVPGSFDLSASISYIAMIVIGGLGTILGSVLGAIMITGISPGISYVVDLLKGSYPGLSKLIVDFRLAIFGLIIVLTLLFEPKGLFGLYRRCKVYWKTWPFRY